MLWPVIIGALLVMLYAVIALFEFLWKPILVLLLIGVLLGIRSINSK